MILGVPGPGSGMEVCLHLQSFWLESWAGGGLLSCLFCRNMQQERAEPPNSPTMREVVWVKEMGERAVFVLGVGTT